MAARQSVHGMPLMVRALGGVEPEGTHLERRKKLETSSQERYTSADTWPFAVQAFALGSVQGDPKPCAHGDQASAANQ